MRPDIERITRVAMAALGMDFSVADVIGKEKLKSFVEVRHLSMWLCRRCLGLSYTELGREFGGRDHRTAMYAVERVHHLMHTRPNSFYSLVAMRLEGELTVKASGPSVVRCTGARELELDYGSDVKIAAAE